MLTIYVKVVGFFLAEAQILLIPLDASNTHYLDNQNTEPDPYCFEDTKGSLNTV